MPFLPAAVIGRRFAFAMSTPARITLKLSTGAGSPAYPGLPTEKVFSTAAFLRPALFPRKTKAIIAWSATMQWAPPRPMTFSSTGVPTPKSWGSRRWSVRMGHIWGWWLPLELPPAIVFITGGCRGRENLCACWMRGMQLTGPLAIVAASSFSTPTWILPGQGHCHRLGATRPRKNWQEIIPQVLTSLTACAWWESDWWSPTCISLPPG